MQSPQNASTHRTYFVHPITECIKSWNLCPKHKSQKILKQLKRQNCILQLEGNNKSEKSFHLLILVNIPLISSWEENKLNALNPHLPL